MPCTPGPFAVSKQCPPRKHDGYHQVKSDTARPKEWRRHCPSAPRRSHSDLQALRAYLSGQELALGVLLDSLQREPLVITADALPQQITTQNKGLVVIRRIQPGPEP